MDQYVAKLSQLPSAVGPFTFEKIMSEPTDAEVAARKTKIICTMGPACWDVPTLVKMIDEGMNVCRLNFSHGDHESHGACVERIKAAMAERPNATLAIMLDTKGPEVRSGFLKNGKSVELEGGSLLKIVTDYDFKGDETCIACSYSELPTSVKPGNVILIADGTIAVEVVSCHADHVITKVRNSATLGERKNMNLPNVKVNLPVCGEREVNDFLKFGIPHKVDLIAASFVQTAEDVLHIRQVCGDAGRGIHVMVKIENVEGLKNFDEILAVTDSVMVARGDMGMEIPPEKVFIAQKMMIQKCNLAGKPVIVATQMLESMIHNSRPTRAECSDVANAVLDGADCVMLSGESANGKFPTMAVRALARTAHAAESTIDYVQRAKNLLALGRPDKGEDKKGLEAVTAANAEKVTAILAITSTETDYMSLSKFRPHAPVIAATKNQRQANNAVVASGVVPLFVSDTSDPQSVIASAAAKQIVQKGDKVLIVENGTFRTLTA